MALNLTGEQRARLSGAGGAGDQIAMAFLAEAASLLGADRLIPVASAHIDGCLYHGDSGTRFAEHLERQGARVAVPTTLNVGAIDLLNPSSVRLSREDRRSALRLMRAYEGLGCRATFTCAPYQAGHRPQQGTDVAWGESNAVAFCNSALGARTNRYGDFLDIACAIAGLAPHTGLHIGENRRAVILYDASALPPSLKADETLWPVLGAMIGRACGDAVVAVDGLAASSSEDLLKAFGAAAAAFGATALFHIIGATPEAPTLPAAFQDAAPQERRSVSVQDVAAGFRLLSSAASDAPVTAVGLGSPHLSLDEAKALATAVAGKTLRLPLFANTGRHVVAALGASGELDTLRAAGVTLVADTCIVTTDILPPQGVLMTDSAKFAQYAPANTGHEVVFAPRAACVATALTGTRVPSVLC